MRKSAVFGLCFLLVMSLGLVVAIECEDSDGGENFEVKGIASGIYAGASEGYNIILGTEPNPQTGKPSPYNYSIVYDYCFSDRQVYESWCSEGKIQTRTVSCDDELENSVCSEGACIPNPLATEKQCDEFGYNTQHGVINYCDETQEDYDLSVCYNKEYTCSDSDGGEDYFSLGRLSVSSSSTQGPSCNSGMGSSGSGGGGGGGSTADYCLNSNILKERICNSDGTAGYVEYECPNGCEDGVCLEESDDDYSSNSSSGGGHGGGTSSSNSSSGGGGSGGACLQGCNINGTCVSVGFRTNGTYCDLSKNLLDQGTEGETCENNFECSSNVCVDSQCVEAGLIQRILNWFRNLFG